MTGAGDLYLYQPGASVPVEVVADSSGTVALRGEGVALAGENRALTEISLTETAGTGVGMLAREPDDYTGDQADYSAGESAGRSELELWKPVARLPVATDFDPAASGTQTPSVGDHVEWAAGGVLQLYNSADAPAPYGEVFSVVRGSGAENVAVAIHR